MTISTSFKHQLRIGAAVSAVALTGSFLFDIVTYWVTNA